MNNTKLRLEGDNLYYGFTHLGKCYPEVDGFYIYDPITSGQFNEYSLRLIADFLEELNNPLSEDLSKYIEEDRDYDSEDAF